MTVLPALAACRALLGVVFAVAALGKLRGRDRFAAFAATLTELPWLPARWHRTVAVAVVSVEIAVAVLLTAPPTVPAGFVLAAGTLAVFTTAVAHALRAGRALRCQCFGTDAGTMGTPQLVRNGVLLTVASCGAVLAVLPGGTAADQAATVSAAAAGALAGLVLTRWDDLVYLVRPAARH
ncbi:MauE/DoxX family redox-associated membrane protein [Catellatospora sp. NPDC049609]|uniref:MauE/DoxX family redox-associated membrane protein n=1 Tax=Catellatospora sp. NPDC049609 TaxID=3155505 RepID=UPI003429B8D8